MNDLISRQAAIDAAVEAADEWDGGHSPTRAYMITNAINKIVPSVQAKQKITHCENCEHKHLEKDVWTCPFGLPSGPEFFCGYGSDTK